MFFKKLVLYICELRSVRENARTSRIKCFHHETHLYQLLPMLKRLTIPPFPALRPPPRRRRWTLAPPPTAPTAPFLFPVSRPPPFPIPIPISVPFSFPVPTSRPPPRTPAAMPRPALFDDRPRLRRRIPSTLPLFRRSLFNHKSRSIVIPRRHRVTRRWSTVAVSRRRPIPSRIGVSSSKVPWRAHGWWTSVSRAVAGWWTAVITRSRWWAAAVAPKISRWRTAVARRRSKPARWSTKGV